jgi:hypothetical protein
MLRKDQRRTSNPHANSRDRCNVPGQDIIVDLLNKIETLREHQNLLAWKLKHVLATGHGGSGYEHHKPLSSAELAALRQVWDEFISQGGVSADDLKRYLQGQKISTFTPVRRRDLRLVWLNKAGRQNGAQLDRQRER